VVLESLNSRVPVEACGYPGVEAPRTSFTSSELSLRCRVRGDGLRRVLDIGEGVRRRSS
jgi:hypothetical protein